MSQLIATEKGRLVTSQCEELSRWRRARKKLPVPQSVHSDGTLYIYARAHSESGPPLVVEVGNEQYLIEAESTAWCWLSVDLSNSIIDSSYGEVILWTDTPGMTGWTLGMEGGYADPESWLSTDGGKNWSNESMGLFHVQRGEYLVRLRLHNSALKPAPPEFICEKSDSPRLKEVRDWIPQEIFDIHDVWKQARAAATWISKLWPYNNGGPYYAPWDALTIQEWGQLAHRYDGHGVTAMCVNYGVVMATVCAALNIPVRCVATTGGVNGGNGHFVTEIFVSTWDKWCLLDANLDAAYMKDGIPLSVADMWRERERLWDLLEAGDGFQVQQEQISSFIENIGMAGKCYRLWAVWPRTDFLTRPDMTPAMHGSGAYRELDWVWCSDGPQDGELDMFMYHASTASFAQYGLHSRPT